MAMIMVMAATAAGVWGLTATQASSASAFAAQEDRDCELKTLRGSYLFAASGFNIVGGVAQPKAIHEVLDFDGDGALGVPFVSLSVNGTVSHPPAGSGIYTIDSTCRGTLVFNNGPSYDIVADVRGETVSMFQTNPNTVFQGTATKFRK
jgi:hypothetical protein